MARYAEVCANGFVCLLCSKTISQKGHMRRHMKEVHQSPEKYKCPPCGLIFRNREIYKHVKKVHPDWHGISFDKFKLTS